MHTRTYLAPAGKQVSLKRRGLWPQEMEKAEAFGCRKNRGR